MALSYTIVTAVAVVEPQRINKVIIMEPVTRIDEEQPLSVVAESVLPEEIRVNLLSLLFCNSIPTLDIVAQKREATLNVKVVQLQIACFIASVVLKCWGQYIEDQAKQAEISKKAAKECRQRKDEIVHQQLMDQIKKEEILHKNLSWSLIRAF